MDRITLKVLVVFTVAQVLIAPVGSHYMHVAKDTCLGRRACERISCSDGFWLGMCGTMKGGECRCLAVGKNEDHLGYLTDGEEWDITRGNEEWDITHGNEQLDITRGNED